MPPEPGCRAAVDRLKLILLPAHLEDRGALIRVPLVIQSRSAGTGTLSFTRALETPALGNQTEVPPHAIQHGCAGSPLAPNTAAVLARIRAFVLCPGGVSHDIVYSAVGGFSPNDFCRIDGMA